MRAAAEALDRPCGRVHYTQRTPRTCLLAFNSTRPFYNQEMLVCLRALIRSLPVSVARSFGLIIKNGSRTPYLQLTASITELCTPRESVFAELTSNPRAPQKEIPRAVGARPTCVDASSPEQLQRKTRQRSADDRGRAAREQSRRTSLPRRRREGHEKGPVLRRRHL